MPRIDTTPVDSSNIVAIGYDAASQTLQVDFKSGKKFQYAKVPADTFAELKEAESVGKYFAANIRNDFDAVMLEEE